MKEHFAKLLEALARQMGIDSLVPEEDMSCNLVFDDIPVSLQYLEADHQLLIYSALGDLPADPEARHSLYSAMLEANYFFRGTGGSVLAIDEKTGIAAYQNLTLMRGLDDTEFLKILEVFLQTATFWRDRCAGVSHPEPADATPGADGSAGPGWMMA